MIFIQKILLIVTQTDLDTIDYSCFQDISRITEDISITNVSTDFNWRDPKSDDIPIVIPFHRQNWNEELQNEFDYLKILFPIKTVADFGK